MRLYAIGANQSKTPVAIRERLAVSAEQLPDVLSSLLERVGRGVLLSTCNRTEIYGVDQDGTCGRNAAVDFLCARAGISRTELRPYLNVHEGESAVRHLFRVACGLDSMIIGEHEVLGQVGEALEGAEKTGSAGLPLLSLFRRAVRTGRRVRHETGLSRNALSVGSVAVDLATRKVGDLRECQILVIGAGEAGRMVAKAARARGASHITVANRSLERASTLAAELGDRSIALDDLDDALVNANVVVTCAVAPATILDRQLVQAAMDRRPERPLVVVDIAVPRNVDTGVRHIRNVSLYDIDDLTQIARTNALLRRGETCRATETVDAEVAKYMAWLETCKVRPTVGALAQKAETIRQAQLDMTLKKLPGLSDEERESLAAMTKAIVKKMLDDPIRCLKRDCSECARQECHTPEIHVQVISELFRLESDATG